MPQDSRQFYNFGGLGNLPLANGADPSKLDMNNMMLSMGPGGTGSLGYRNNENGTFAPVTDNLDFSSLGAKEGSMYQGNFNSGFEEFGNSQADKQKRFAAMFGGGIRPGYFNSQGDFDGLMSRLGFA